MQYSASKTCFCSLKSFSCSLKVPKKTDAVEHLLRLQQSCPSPAAAEHQAQSPPHRGLAAPWARLGTRAWILLPSQLLRASPCWPPGTGSCPRDKQNGKEKPPSFSPQAHKIHFQPETLNVNYVGKKGLEIEMQQKQK